MSERRIDADVVVIGGGGAGYRAAIGAREKGARTVLLSKGPLARCGASPMAGADFTLDGLSLSRMGFPGAPHDTEAKFFNDILTQGYYLNNQKLIEQYIRNAPARLQELLQWGLKVIFSEERAIFTSGLGLMDILLRRSREVGAEVLEDTMAIDLLMADGRVAGVLALHVPSGEFLHLSTKAVVLATGGWHKAFWPNTGMRDLSGEGMVMAHRAGALLGNMEFITFCCNVLLSPPVWRGSIATYILGLLCGGELINSKGEAFLKSYDPFVVEKGTTMEWNKGFLSYATARQVRDGKGSPNGGVYLRRGKIPWETYEKTATSTIFPNWKYKAMDLTELARMLKENEPIEVGPAVEYFDGGIVVNERLETGVEGLYAAGECTLGPFGANRVCSAITEMLVHGADAGANAAEYAGRVKVEGVGVEAYRAMEEEARRPLERREGLRPAGVRRRVQEMAHRYLGPIRTERELLSFVEFLEGVEKGELPYLSTVSKGRVYNKEWLDALELPGMVHLLKAAALSALARTESRGVHFREDYPETDNHYWLQESLVRYEGGVLSVSKRPITVTSVTPPKGKWPFLEMMKKMMAARSDVGGHH
jgi:succinate dehydrogenase/fumarate reductase flavoprotein subunit